MEKYLNTTKATLSLFFVAAAELLNKIPLLLMIFILAVIADYITGFVKAKFQHNWNSRDGAEGIIKKVMYFVAIGVSFLVGFAIVEIGVFVNLNLDFAINIGWYTMSVMLLNELTSILENLYIIMPDKIPVWLIKILKIAENATSDKINSFVCKNQNCEECELKRKCANKRMNGEQKEEEQL